MKRPLTVASILIVALSTVVAAGAAPARKPAPVTETELLHAAYKTLALADHDYKGHRAKAMHEIEAACDKLNSDVRGEGKGHEKQAVSDAQLREAKQFLEQARDHLTARHEDFVAKHIDAAVKELDIALTIQ